MTYIPYQTRLCCLVLLSAGLLHHIKLANSRGEEVFYSYVTPIQPPNPECPKNNSCQTLQYFLENIATFAFSRKSSESNKGVTLLFLNGNHTVASCNCTRLYYFSAYFSIIGLSGNIIIHNLDAIIYIVHLTIDNIIFYNGLMSMNTAMYTGYKLIQLRIDSVQLIECALYIENAELGKIVKLQAHNSQVSIRSSNMTFTNCTFHDFDEIPYPTQLLRTPIETAVTVHQSHITFSDNSKFYSNHNSALISYLAKCDYLGRISVLFQ